MPSLPIVAIVGRPNVGKSTLANRLAGSKSAIVYGEPGITRDRTYQPSFWRDRDFLVVDTGGLVFGDDTEFLPMIRQQVMAALAEAQVVVLVLDGQAGLTDADQTIAQWLREQPLPVVVAVNKCESVDQGAALAAEFWRLGLGEPMPISSIHGNGTGDLLDRLVTHLPPTPETLEDEEIKVAILGRPNVGKSSLLNALVGETRVIVSPVAGTTRDAVDTVIEQQGQRYRLIDTAGIRKKKHIDYGPEFFSINRAFQAIRRADVVLLVIDALDGVTDQDRKLAGRIETEGRGCVVIVNKWDAVEKDSHTIYAYEQAIREKLYFLDWASLLFVSALKGQRVDKILEQVSLCTTQHRRRVTTAVINEVLQEAVGWRSPPATRQGQQGKIYYGTQVSAAPPTLVLFVNDPHRFPPNYRRYVEHQFRQHLGFAGTPIRLLWRGKKAREVVSPA